jgi:hypothetical protein
MIPYRDWNGCLFDLFTVMKILVAPRSGEYGSEGEISYFGAMSLKTA